MDERLSRRVAAARARAQDLRADLARVAGRIAETEEHAADVLDEVAATHPDRRDRLQAMAANARAFAAQEREAAEQP